MEKSNIPEFSGNLDPERLSHAVIIEGNVEKGLLLAKHISAIALCTGDEKPCGVCNACHKTEGNIHPDIFTYVAPTAARSFHKEIITQIKDEAYIKPNEGYKKIYVLGNAQSMTVSAQNALLKLLEEPPSYIILMLLLPSAPALLNTVRSRSVCLTLSGGDVLPGGEALSCCTNAIKELTNKSEFEFMKFFGAWDKDKEAFSEALTVFYYLFRDALALKLGGQALLKDSEPVTAAVGSKLTTAQLKRLVDTVTATKKRIAQNANQSLLVTKFGADLRSNIDL